MRYEVALTADADRTARDHLLQHFRKRKRQEDVCFAIWRPSTGANRYTALIDRVELPEPGERLLHGNASFEPEYMSRVIREARERDAGIALMHSHPGEGWQGMSEADVEAERDVLAYPAGATGLPLLGLTIGSDGYWSARFWERDGKRMARRWCEKARIVGSQSCGFQYNDSLRPPKPRIEALRRTYDTWGAETQDVISRLNVGVVGLGSVGCIVAESMARIGVGHITLIDHDRVERHNLDRLLYGSVGDVGELKVRLAEKALRRSATAEKIQIDALPVSIQQKSAYKAALDCDVIFSCVDKPVARDVLNFIANAHLIPVIDGGVHVETDKHGDAFFSAHWRAHIITPCHQCLRCSGQYNSSMVVTELDGSLDDPSYIANLPAEERGGNQNVFPFSLGVAGMEVNLMLRYLLAQDWWPPVAQQEYQFLTARTSVANEECHQYCSFRQRRARGDAEAPHYLIDDGEVATKFDWRDIWRRLAGVFKSR